MKLEDLTKLGIAEDVANQVVSMNEAEVAAEAKKLTDKEAELTMATDKIKELTETVRKFDGVDVEKMKSEIENWSKKYNEDTTALKMENAISKTLAGCGAKDADIVGKLIDRSIVKFGDDGKLMGIEEQLQKLKTDKAFLFGGADEADKSTGMTVQLGTQHTAPTASGDSFGFKFTGVRPAENSSK